MLSKKIIVLILSFWCFVQNGEVLANNLKVDTLTTLIDYKASPFKQLQPGDTVFLLPGNRDYLLIRNFQGQPAKPFVFINKGGVVVIDTDHYFGISLQNCRYFRLTGSGNSENFYGINIKRVINGTGVGIGALSSDFEIDHVSIRNVPISGIIAKTDPDCLLTATRENFTQYNTRIHDNYIENAGNEGMYVGSTKYYGQTVKCDGVDVLLLPSLLDGVKIYNNIIKYSGWDGIQVSSATKNCQVFDNLILFDSQEGVLSQMSGIILGGGSKCDCYNNYIADGKGDGIENHGLGGNRIFNNIIVNAGKSYFPDDFTGPKMKYGIYVTDVSAQTDSSFYIQNNTIVNPKSDGIRFSSIKSKHNLISSNAIINPGNFDYYENGNTHFKGIDSYVMISDASSDISLKNNYFARNLVNSGLLSDYSLDKNSPLVNAGYISQPQIAFDFKYHQRRSDNPPDIGAYEYDLGTGIDKTKKNPTGFMLFPNPVRTELTVRFEIELINNVDFSIYSMSGNRILNWKTVGLAQKTNSLTVNISELVSGVYLYSFKTGDQLYSGKFFKVD